jgi:hypothetical protein
MSRQIVLWGLKLKDLQERDVSRPLLQISYEGPGEEITQVKEKAPHPILLSRHFKLPRNLFACWKGIYFTSQVSPARRSLLKSPRPRLAMTF